MVRPGIAFSEYEGWRIDQANYSRHTWNGEKPGLIRLCAYLPMDDLAETTDSHLTQWWLDVQDKYEPSTQVTRLAQVRSFLKYCRTRGWIEGDPTALLRAPGLTPKERERLSADELLALLEYARYPRDRAVLALAMNLALRGGEIAKLRVGDVDLAGGTIAVTIEKTKDSHRMPITLELGSELSRWFLHYRDVCPSFGRDSYLVPSQHVSANTITYRPDTRLGEPYEVVKRVLIDAGWDPEHVKQEGVHTIRRSVARVLFDSIEAELGGGKGAEDSALLTVMTLLHHSRPETTLRYIGKNKLRDALDDRLRGKSFLGAIVRPDGLAVTA